MENKTYRNSKGALYQPSPRPAINQTREKASLNSCLNKDCLEKLDQGPPDMVTKIFLRRRDDFVKVMKTCCKDGIVVSVLFSILAKVTKIANTDTTISLTSALRDSLFLENVAVPYLFSLVGTACENVNTVSNAISLLKYTADNSFNSVVSFYSVLTVVSDLIQEIKLSDLCTPDLDAEFDDFDHIYRKIHSIRRKQKKKIREAEDNLLPPDDFRSINIVPTAAELVGSAFPFLRKNKEFGSYIDLEHYLDVQFRLLREDFVAALRESIQNYKADRREGKTLGERVYDGVKIVGTTTSHDGICHLVKIDTSRSKNVEWEFDKRLIYGSLLCLSFDEFETVYFAVVSRREATDLRQGILEVRFTCSLETLHSIANKIFVVVESEVYFEAYRHNLLAVQLIFDLPFKEYIVKCEENIKAPSYVKENECEEFDLTVLSAENTPQGVSENKSSTNKHKEIKDKNIQITQRITAPRMKKVNLLKDSAWPRKSVLGLDRSQYQALKNALTHEVSITQGPPGTGKTYIGLKIARALLANKQAWSSSDCKQPLLVVCYTNRALDQFLCGIVEFYEGAVIRVGGRSSNETMQSHKHNIKTLYKNISSEIFEEVEVLRAVADETAKRIKELKYQIFKSTRELVKVDDLQRYIGRLQKSLDDGLERKLKYSKKYIKEKEQLSADTLDSIQEWLGCGRLPCKSKLQVNFSVADTQNSLSDIESVAAGWDDVKRLSSYYEAISCFSNKIIVLSNSKNTDVQISGKNSVAFKDIYPMSKESQKRVKDVWNLSYKERWGLYKSWVNDHKFNLIENLKEYEENYEKNCLEVKQTEQRKQIEALRNADVIGMTTTGAAKNYKVLQHVKPKIVIVEEAAEVLEGHIITSLSTDCEQLILIGDHKQLRPSPAVYQLAKRYKLDISLFERLIKNKVHYECLEYQHRMRPEISLIIRLFYPNLKNHISVMNKPDIKGISSNVFFVAHTHPEEDDKDNPSHYNKYEAKFLVALCRYLLKQGYKPSEITVLTTYSAQLIYLKRSIQRSKEFDGINISVVDNYQGEENEIVLLSLVRSNASNRIGFIKTENRVNVALSRARNGLFVIGNFEAFAKVSEVWKDIVDLLRKENQIGPALPLFCRNHSEKKLFAKDASDFANAPEGGCSVNCDARLDCGHVCNLKCHVYDPDHKEYECHKPCRKICKNEHPCHKQCFQDCGSCQVPMTKEMPGCEHLQTMPCYIEPAGWNCQVPCEDTLDCGHKCQSKCSDTNHDCRIKISTTIEKCGHNAEIECCERKERIYCHKPCEYTLACGHKCARKCYQVHTSLCFEMTDKVMRCGHSIQQRCYRSTEYIKCKQPCRVELQCGHKCKNRCCDSHTERCMEKVEKELLCCRRKHNVLCSADIADTECPFSCQEILPCGHRCKNKCGEPHTSYCQTPVEKVLLCKHTLKVYCGANLEEIECSFPCRDKLQCGHACKNLCSEPHQEKCDVQLNHKCPHGHTTQVPCYRVHNNSEIECYFKCRCQLECGHICSGSCFDCDGGVIHKACFNCPSLEERYHLPVVKAAKGIPCIANCQNRCAHRRCDKLCFEPCADNNSRNWPCTEQCDAECEHFYCQKQYFEQLNRPFCTSSYNLIEKMFKKQKLEADLGDCHTDETDNKEKLNDKHIRFHKSCGIPLEVSVVKDSLKKNEKIESTINESQGEFPPFGEELCTRFARKVFEYREQKKVNSEFYIRHRNIREQLTILNVRVPEMNPYSDLYKIYKYRLEKTEENFRDWLHFQQQGYKDMRKELDRLQRVSDIILAKQGNGSKKEKAEGVTGEARCTSKDVTSENRGKESVKKGSANVQEGLRRAGEKSAKPSKERSTVMIGKGSLNANSKVEPLTVGKSRSSSGGRKDTEEKPGRAIRETRNAREERTPLKCRNGREMSRLGSKKEDSRDCMKRAAYQKEETEKLTERNDNPNSKTEDGLVMNKSETEEKDRARGAGSLMGINENKSEKKS